MLRELVLAIGSSVCTLAAKYRWSASSSEWSPPPGEGISCRYSRCCDLLGISG
jgi:hypothetical protein